MTSPLPHATRRKHLRLRLLLAPAAVAVAMPGLAGLSSGAASAATSSTGTPIPNSWSLAKVHLTVQSSSDWSTIALAGVVISGRQGTATGGTKVSPLSNGWSLSGAGTYQADVVLVATAADLKVTVQKGNVGTTAVTVTRSGTSTPMLVTTDALHGSLANPANSTVATLLRSDLAAAVVPDAALPHGDKRKLTLAFAYPWFTDYTNAGLAEKPAVARSWSTAAGVLSMTQQAKAHGVDGFVLSYAGEQNSGAALDRALAAAHQTSSLVSPYLETSMAINDAKSGDPAAMAETWLRSALLRSNDPSFLKASGAPVVFVYDMARLTADQWATIRAHLTADGLSVKLIGDATAPAYAAVEAGQHAFSAVDDIATLAKRSQWLSAVQRSQSLLDGTTVPPIDVATVSPGYDDHVLRGITNPVISRDSGRRYTDTWAAALSGTPDWVVVTTWNEWYEGTSIEPGTATGGLALDQTQQQASAWHSVP